MKFFGSVCFFVLSCNRRSMLFFSSRSMLHFFFVFFFFFFFSFFFFIAVFYPHTHTNTHAISWVSFHSTLIKWIVSHSFIEHQSLICSMCACISVSVSWAYIHIFFSLLILVHFIFSCTGNANTFNRNANICVYFIFSNASQQFYRIIVSFFALMLIGFDVGQRLNVHEWYIHQILHLSSQTQIQILSMLFIRDHASFQWTVWMACDKPFCWNVLVFFFFSLFGCQKQHRFISRVLIICISFFMEFVQKDWQLQNIQLRPQIFRPKCHSREIVVKHLSHK